MVLRERPRYTVGEEIANSVSHGVGLILAIAGLGVLTAFSALLGNAWHIVSCSVFATTMILMYLASTLYHGIPHLRAKPILRLLDHSAIFLLIAGTYTPFALVNLRGTTGWIVFGAVWTLAILGIVCRCTVLRHRRSVMVSLYIAMGWLVLFVVKPLYASVGTGGLTLLLLGGVAYTVGVIFYRWRELPYHHAIWHGFVLVGSVFHFLAVLFYVIPLAK